MTERSVGSSEKEGMKLMKKNDLERFNPLVQTTLGAIRLTNLIETFFSHKFAPDSRP